MNATYLQSSIALSIARAQWWTAYANSPANLARTVWAGASRLPKDKLCASELIDDAMQTAQNHLTNAQEALDQLNTVHG